MQPAINRSIAAPRSIPPQQRIRFQTSKLRQVFAVLACTVAVLFGLAVLARARFESRVYEDVPAVARGKITLPAIVREASKTNLKVSAIKLPADANVDEIQMVNEREGWLWDYGTELYKTTDGGDQWTRIHLQLPARSHISNAYFSSADAGWIAASKNELDFDDAKGTGEYDDATWIFETRDGGKTLTERFTIADGQITQINFLDAKEGWATGRMFRAAANGVPERDANLVLHTTNGGQDWSNLSARLPEDRGIEKLRVLGPGTTLLLTHYGFISKTTDGGEHWTSVEKLDYENNRIAIHKFDLRGEGYWALGGQSCIEGWHSMFAAQDKAQQWTFHEINDVHFTDAMFLSDSEMLASGFIQEFSAKNPDAFSAVLVYSPDKGGTWIVLSRYPQSRRLSGLALTDTNHVLAVGYQGLVLKIELPLNRISWSDSQPISKSYSTNAATSVVNLNHRDNKTSPFYSAKNAVPNSKRVLDQYDNGGHYTIRLNTDAATRSRQEASIREFLWQHWRGQRYGRISATWYSREGEPSTSSFFVEPDAGGNWNLSVEIIRSLNGRGGSSWQSRESVNYSAYSVERIEIPKDGLTPRTTIPKEQPRSPESYRLMLKDRNGKILTEI
jgi:photosystem II stability/assembly factor-like uncharacterized protein